MSKRTSLFRMKLEVFAAIIFRKGNHYVTTHQHLVQVSWQQYSSSVVSFKISAHIMVDVHLLIPNYCPTSATAHLQKNQALVWFVIKSQKRKRLFCFLSRLIHLSHLEGWQLVIMSSQSPEVKVFPSRRPCRREHCWGTQGWAAQQPAKVGPCYPDRRESSASVTSHLQTEIENSSKNK